MNRIETIIESVMDMYADGDVMMIEVLNSIEVPDGVTFAEALQVVAECFYKSDNDMVIRVNREDNLAEFCGLNDYPEITEFTNRVIINQELV